MATPRADPAVLLGIDGGTFDVLDELADAGVMPFLRWFRGRAARARLASTANWLTPQAWTTVVTGRTPGNHGVFDFVRAEERPGGLYFTLTDARDVACETIWQTASGHGRSVAALNLPVMFPPKPVTGVVVPGFVPWRHLRRYTYPREAFAELESIPGFDQRRLGMDLDVERHTVQGLDPAEMLAWVWHHIDRERQWAAVLEYQLASRQHDLLAINFDGNDKLLHLFWRYVVLEPGTELEPHEMQIRDACLTYYRELDGHLARAFAAAGPNARVFVVSDHGFGPCEDVVYLNTWLERRGHLVWGATAEPDTVGALTVDRLRHHVEMIDWDATVAYVLTPSSNGIVIRVAAQDGDPGVCPEDYVGFRQRLIDDLLRFTHPIDGSAVMTRVRTREDAYPGSRSDLAPDLLVTLRDGGFVSILRSECEVRRRVEVVGTHREHGVLLAVGPGVEPGAHPDQSIVDVAPTLLSAIGVPVPNGYEGRPLDAFYSAPAELSPAEPKRVPVARMASTTARDPVYSPEEEADVLGRLESLGYL